jgi:hypothetical protein
MLASRMITSSSTTTAVISGMMRGRTRIWASSIATTDRWSATESVCPICGNHLLYTTGYHACGPSSVRCATTVIRIPRGDDHGYTGMLVTNEVGDAYLNIEVLEIQHICATWRGEPSVRGTREPGCVQDPGRRKHLCHFVRKYRERPELRPRWRRCY